MAINRSSLDISHLFKVTKPETWMFNILKPKTYIMYRQL